VAPWLAQSKYIRESNKQIGRGYLNETIAVVRRSWVSNAGGVCKWNCNRKLRSAGQVVTLVPPELA
jgi:hypothetical protein